jgi:hypothetical protein
VNPTEDQLIGRIDASRKRLRTRIAPVLVADERGWNVAPTDAEERGHSTRPRVVVVTWNVKGRRGR